MPTPGPPAAVSLPSVVTWWEGRRRRVVGTAPAAPKGKAKRSREVEAAPEPAPDAHGRRKSTRDRVQTQRLDPAAEAGSSRASPVQPEDVKNSAATETPQNEGKRTAPLRLSPDLAAPAAAATPQEGTGGGWCGGMPASADAPSHAQLRYAMYEYLQAVIRSGKMTEEQTESLEVAAQCMSEAFGFSTEVPEGGQHELSLKPLTLPVIFNTGVQVLSGPPGREEGQKTTDDRKDAAGPGLSPRSNVYVDTDVASPAHTRFLGTESVVALANMRVPGQSFCVSPDACCVCSMHAAGLLWASGST